MSKIGLYAIAQPSFTHSFLFFFGVRECKAFLVLLQASALDFILNALIERLKAFYLLLIRIFNQLPFYKKVFFAA